MTKNSIGAPSASPASPALPARGFSKLLIANRGEIACRIIRTAKAMGLSTVAVYSDADHAAQHVRMADEAVRLGPSPPRESYLAIDRLLEAAERSRAEAVHPGYGFLSENAVFAQRCAEAGLVFVGPTAAMIEAMGSKVRAKALMQQAGVPLVPGYHEAAQDIATLAAAAERIGYPVLIKASAGGGGRGMRIVETPDALESAIASAQREAVSAFGDGQLLIEKYITQPRHIEVQVIGDSHGQLISLAERECTLQRRHQKVIEEAPSPTLDPRQRDAIAAAARAAAQAVGYVGAGTVEFVSDGRSFYFIEMNTRLQVEHPVTEMITGIDLVEWQLRIAQGEKLPLTQAEVQVCGHAIEARLYAEDPAAGFLPSAGTIAAWLAPQESTHVRIDAGYGAGDAVPPFYDAMLAKLVTWGEDRSAALARMVNALDSFAVDGVTTNLAFLSALMRHPEVAANRIDTGFIERELPRLTAPPPAPQRLEAAAAVAAILHSEVSARDAREAQSPWARGSWIPLGARTRRFDFREGLVHTDHGREFAAVLREDSGGAQLSFGTDAAMETFAWKDCGGGRLAIELGGHRWQVQAFAREARVNLVTPNGRFCLQWLDPFGGAHEHDADAGHIVAPLPGTVVALMTEEGAHLEKGAPLLTLEAMKMEHTLRAPLAGTVRRLHCKRGDFVQEGTELVDFEPDEAD